MPSPKIRKKRGIKSTIVKFLKRKRMGKKMKKKRGRRRKNQKGGVGTSIKDLDRYITKFLTADQLHNVKTISKAQKTIVDKQIKKRGVGILDNISDINTTDYSFEKAKKIGIKILPLLINNKFFDEFEAMIMKPSYDTDETWNNIDLIGDALNMGAESTLKEWEIRFLYLQYLFNFKALTGMFDEAGGYTNDFAKHINNMVFKLIKIIDQLRMIPNTKMSEKYIPWFKDLLVDYIQEWL